MQEQDSNGIPRKFKVFCPAQGEMYKSYAFGTVIQPQYSFLSEDEAMQQVAGNIANSSWNKSNCFMYEFEADSLLLLLNGPGGGCKMISCKHIEENNFLSIEIDRKRNQIEALQKELNTLKSKAAQ